MTPRDTLVVVLVVSDDNYKHNYHNVNVNDAAANNKFMVQLLS